MNHEEEVRRWLRQRDAPELLHQQEGEPIDFFAMRAFLVAMGKVDDHAARAMIQWIAARGFSDLIKRKAQRRNGRI